MIMSNPIHPRSGLSRRTFLRIAAFAGVVGAARLIPCSAGKAQCYTVRKSLPMMGTMLNLTVYSPDQDQAEAAVTATVSRMQGLEKKLSRHRQTSEVTTLNRTGSLSQPSPELHAVLESANTVHKKTAGAFDITVLPLLTQYQKQGGSLVSQTTLMQSLMRNIGQEQLHLTPEAIYLHSGKAVNAGITLDGIGKGYIV
ncbi:MAG: FAD:protein FMN transferase, partial [Candidatus Electrothrix sp. EH2]|nr:FAD:protein FMN transferase [Candidatus Electrothrix sp. EH2]